MGDFGQFQRAIKNDNGEPNTRWKNAIYCSSSSAHRSADGNKTLYKRWQPIWLLNCGRATLRRCTKQNETDFGCDETL